MQWNEFPDDVRDELMEAMKGITGAKNVIDRTRRPTFRLRLMRFYHRFGIHTRVPGHSYDFESGVLRYEGLRCLFCELREL